MSFSIGLSIPTNSEILVDIGMNSRPLVTESSTVVSVTENK